MHVPVEETVNSQRKCRVQVKILTYVGNRNMKWGASRPDEPSQYVPTSPEFIDILAEQVEAKPVEEESKESITDKMQEDAQQETA